MTLAGCASQEPNTWVVDNSNHTSQRPEHSYVCGLPESAFEDSARESANTEQMNGFSPQESAEEIQRLEDLMQRLEALQEDSK